MSKGIKLDDLLLWAQSRQRWILGVDAAQEIELPRTVCELVAMAQDSEEEICYHVAALRRISGALQKIYDNYAEELATLPAKEDLKIEDWQFIKKKLGNLDEEEELRESEEHRGYITN